MPPRSKVICPAEREGGAQLIYSDPGNDDQRNRIDAAMEVHAAPRLEPIIGENDNDQPRTSFRLPHSAHGSDKATVAD